MQGSTWLPSMRGFARHIREEAPRTAHLELDYCGHVPQLERPGLTHEAIRVFLATGATRDARA